MLEGRKVLVLESDAAAAFPLGAALRRNGWAVIAAQDAAQAMQVARQQKPDAVVINALLAGGGGIVALKRLRSSVYTTAIPAICIAAPNGRDRAELAAAGAQEMIDPPGDPDAINAALSKCLGRAEMTYAVPPAVLGSRSRTAALEESGLLDSAEDERLDELTRLAATLLGVPVALVSVVDSTRQFFKSQTGLPEPWRSARQTPLSHSFCQWVVGGNEEVVICDVSQDPVLRSNLAVRDLGVSAYAGIPFRAKPGETLGSFCAIDTVPKEWTESELATLRDLSLVLESYLADTRAGDAQTKITTVANGIMGAARALLRDSERCGNAERLTLGRMVEEQSRRLVRLQGS